MMFRYYSMAEMNGPYIPDAHPQMWISELQGHIGVIPSRVEIADVKSVPNGLEIKRGPIAL